MGSYYFLRQANLVQQVSLGGSPFGVTDVRQFDLGPPLQTCQANVTFDLSLDHFPDRLPTVFCLNQAPGGPFTTGIPFVYDYDGFSKKDYIKGNALGVLGPQWQLHIFRTNPSALTVGIGANLLGHNKDRNPSNPDAGRMKIWYTSGAGTIGPGYDLGSPWFDWEFQLGDFDGDQRHEIVGRKTRDDTWGHKTGDIWSFVLDENSKIIQQRYLGNIGLEWNLQVADMNGDSYADVFGYNANNDLWVWNNIDDGSGGRRLNAGHSYGKLGTEWQQLQLAYLKGDGYPDLLGLATTGEIRGWYTNGSTITGTSNLGNAPGWTLLAGAPQTAAR